MTDPLTNGQNQVPRPPRTSRPALAVGALAVALLVGSGVSIAVASPAHPAAAAGSAQAAAVVATTGSSGTSSAPTTTSTAPTKGSRPKRAVHRPHLEGTVTAVGSGTITIKDREGFRRQIKTSSKTVYKGGLKSPLAVGTHILARGTVDANGTSLDATTIRKAPARADGNRHHRRAKHGTASTRPSSKSAPSSGVSATPSATTSASPTTS